MQTMKPTAFKALSGSGDPSSFVSKNLQDLVSDSPEDTVPIIDYPLLISDDVEQRRKAIGGLGQDCDEWGFFMLINHGMLESLVKRMMEGLEGFFNLSDEEKKVPRERVMDPIRCGSSFNAAVENGHCWRDFLDVFVHSEFHFPLQPTGFWYISASAILLELVKAMVHKESVAGPIP